MQSTFGDLDLEGGIEGIHCCILPVQLRTEKLGHFSATILWPPSFCTMYQLLTSVSMFVNPKVLGEIAWNMREMEAVVTSAKLQGMESWSLRT